jgi:hypothetical protein
VSAWPSRLLVAKAPHRPRSKNEPGSRAKRLWRLTRAPHSNRSLSGSGDINFTKRFPKQTCVAAPNDGLEQRLHRSKAFRQLRRVGPVVLIQTPVSFLRSFDSLAQELLAKMFANEGMRIDMPWIVRIFAREEASPSQPGKNGPPLCLAQVERDSVRPGIAGGSTRISITLASAGRSNRPNIRRTESSGPSSNHIWELSITFRA